MPFLPSALVMATLSHLRTACLMVTMHQSMQRPLGLCLWHSSSLLLLSILTGSPAGKLICVGTCLSGWTCEGWTCEGGPVGVDL